MKILGISRAACFSPNSELRDATIFKCVSDELKSIGYEVVTQNEEDFSTLVECDAIFTMGRLPRVVNILHAAERAGVPVINSPRAILAMNRLSLRFALSDAGISQPSWRCAVDGVEGFTFPLWWKRSVSGAQKSDDVRFISDIKEWNADLESKDAIIEAHESGRLMKFYGVGNSFFFISNPTFNKFGLEIHNEISSEDLSNFSSNSLKHTATIAAATVGLEVYGGDAVLRTDGTWSLIDLNDWPSFSPCRNRAAKEIAALIDRRTISTKR